MKRKIRMGMIGGGEGSFIGAVHRIAANLDGQIELVCGCFSSRPEVSLKSGRSLFLPDNRIYASYQEMIEREASLPEGERMDFVSIVTPNNVHFGPAMMALEHGFHVVLDKPMTFTLDEAIQLRDKVRSTGLLFMLTHTYTAYPMVREARERVRRGELGKIRRIYVEYPPALRRNFLPARTETPATPCEETGAATAWDTAARYPRNYHKRATSAPCPTPC